MDDNQHSDNPEGVGNEEAATGETTSAAGSSSSAYVTPEQLRDFSKELMGDIRKTVAGMLKTQPSSPPPKQDSKPSQGMSQADIHAMIQQDRMVERAIAKHGFSDTQRDTLRGLIDRAQPDDAAAFINDFAKQFASAGTPATQPKETSTMANPNPASDGGTPGRTPTLESDDLPAWKWSQEKVDRYIKEHGYRKFASYMKQKLPKDLHGVRFHIPRSGE